MSNQLLWSVLSSVKFTVVHIQHFIQEQDFGTIQSRTPPFASNIHTYWSCPRVTLCMEVILVICVPTSAMWTSLWFNRTFKILFNHPRWVLCESNQVQALSSCRHCFWCMQLASFIEFLVNADCLLEWNPDSRLYFMQYAASKLYWILDQCSLLVRMEPRFLIIL